MLKVGGWGDACPLIGMNRGHAEIAVFIVTRYDKYTRCEDYLRFTRIAANTFLSTASFCKPGTLLI